MTTDTSDLCQTRDHAGCTDLDCDCICHLYQPKPALTILHLLLIIGLLWGTLAGIVVLADLISGR